MGVDAVAPLGSVGYHGPEEDHIGLRRPSLAAEGFADGIPGVVHGAQELQGVLHGEVMIRAGNQAFHILYHQIGLEFVPRAAAGNGAQGGVALTPELFDALGRPEEEAQLQKAHAFAGVDPGAAAIPDQAQQIVLPRQRFKIPGQGSAGIFVPHGLLHQGRLGALQFLVRFKILFIGVIFQISMGKGSAFGDQLRLNLLVQHMFSFTAQIQWPPGCCAPGILPAPRGSQLCRSRSGG